MTSTRCGRRWNRAGDFFGHLEVTASGEAVGRVRAGQLIQRDALRPWHGEFDCGSVRDAESRFYVNPSVVHLPDGILEVGDPVHQHGPISLEVPGEPQGRR